MLVWHLPTERPSGAYRLTPDQTPKGGRSLRPQDRYRCIDRAPRSGSSGGTAQLSGLKDLRRVRVASFPVAQDRAARGRVPKRHHDRRPADRAAPSWAPRSVRALRLACARGEWHRSARRFGIVSRALTWHQVAALAGGRLGSRRVHVRGVAQPTADSAPDSSRRRPVATRPVRPREVQTQSDVLRVPRGSASCDWVPYMENIEAPAVSARVSQEPGSRRLPR